MDNDTKKELTELRQQIHDMKRGGDIFCAMIFAPVVIGIAWFIYILSQYPYK